MALKRVYHPTLDYFKDVPEGDVDRWADAGWRKTKPKHVDDSERPEVGSFAPVDVPNEAVFLEPQPAKAAPAKVDGK